MLPSPRQQPRAESIHSWWSDSNPTGPNINLHAATKPLLRRMHNRQALALIRKNRGSPLSSKDVEIYTSYLWFKYASLSTKIAILRETYERADSEEDALTVVNSLALYHIDALLESPNDAFRSQTCMILARLACHETTVAAVLAINPCERLVSILQDDNAEVVENDVYALYCLATWQEGAQALVDAGVLECTESLLSSGEPRIRRWTCGMLARLLQRTPTLPAIADSVVKLFNQLASSLRVEARLGTALDLMESAALALFWSIRFSQGAQEAILLDCLSDLLESRNFEVRKWTCKMLGDLARHESITIAVWSVNRCPQLVSLLQDTHIEVIQSAAEALSWIATGPEGAQAVVDAKVLDWVAEAQGTRSLEWPRRMLENVLSHTLDPKHCQQLVSSDLRANYLEVMARVLCALSKIATSPEGALAVVDAKVLDRIAGLFESPNTDIKRWTCQLLGDVGSHKRMLEPVFARTSLNKLVEFLRDKNEEVIVSAVYALSWIAALSEAAQAMIDARVLDCMTELLDSQNPDIRRWTCKLLRQLAGHQITLAAVLAINPCERLVSCLHDQNVRVVRNAAQALFWIVSVPDGAQGALDKDVFQHVMELFKSPEPGVWRWACGILGQLSSHETMLPAVLAAKPCAQLVSLLSDKKLVVIEGAVAALYVISRLPEGTQAAVDAHVLDYVPQLLKSPNTRVRSWTCKMLAELAQTMAAVVLRVKPCKQLVSLLRDEDIVVVESAVYALSLLTTLPKGAQDVVDTNFLGSIAQLLNSPSSDVQIWTCRLLGHLAVQKTTPAAVLSEARKRLAQYIGETRSP